VIAGRRSFTLAAVFLAGVACKGANGAALGEAAGAVAVNAAVAVAAAAASPSEHGYVSNDDDPNDPGKRGPHVIDVEHARATLLETNLAPCWPAKAPHGPGYVQVTFLWNGTVTHVAVTRPPNGTAPDGACVADRLRDVIIDPFEGDPVVVRVTYPAS
jgi:hypothetical protein